MYKKSLIAARRGNLNRGYTFAGNNVWRTDKIIPVKELMNTLQQEFEVFIEKTALVSC